MARGHCAGTLEQDPPVIPHPARRLSRKTVTDPFVAPDDTRLMPGHAGCAAMLPLLC